MTNSWSTAGRSGAREPAWKSMPWPMLASLTKVMVKRSPILPCRVGPGAVPLKVHRVWRTPGATSTTVSRTVMVRRCSAAPGAAEHRLTMTVRDTVVEVAPGVRQTLWTFNGTAPGPTLHGKIGDLFTITFVNDASMGHGIDFHAGSLAPDLPAVDHEFVIVQSELYLGPQNGTADEAKIAAEKPDAIFFNGYVNQYDHAPIRIPVGERIRVWVVDAGPQRATAFHVVGTQFDTVFKEGAYLLRAGNAEHGASQVLDLAPAQGGFVEFVLPQAGHYPFIDHAMVDGQRGAHGIFEAF